MQLIATRFFTVLLIIVLTSGLVYAQAGNEGETGSVQNSSKIVITEAGNMITAWSEIANHPEDIRNSSASLAKTGPTDIMAKWSEIADLPEPMRENAGAYAAGSLYSISGKSQTFSSKVYKYDFFASSWSQVASLPKARSLSMAEGIGSKLYVVGGHSSSDPFVTEGAVYEYDPAADSWATKAVMPTPVVSAASFVYDDKIYVLGGATTNFSVQTDVIQIYDPATDSWTLSTSKLPVAVRSFDAGIVGNTVVAVGGYVSTGGGSLLADVYKGTLSGTEITWEKLADFPGGGIMLYSMGSDDSKVYLTGGYNDQTIQSGNASAQTFSFDPATDTWTGEAMKPTPMFVGTQMIIDGTGKFYVAGGMPSVQTFTPKCEVMDAQAAAVPEAVFPSTVFTKWVKRTTVYNADFLIANVGGAKLEWSATSDAGSSAWLTLDNSSGEIEPGMSNHIEFTIDPNSLSEGQHTGTITVTTNDPEAASIDLIVGISVQEADVDEDLNVLVEQYTGTWCVWCPEGAKVLADMAIKYGDRMVRTSWHDSDPMEIGSWDQMNTFMSVSGFPTGSVGRVTWPGNSSPPISRGDWDATTEYLLQNHRSPVGITVTDKAYDGTSRQYSFKVTVKFHQGMMGDVRLNALVTEDDLNHAQKSNSGTLNPYYHQTVVMGIWPDIYGEQLGGSNIASQTEITKEFSFLSPHIDASKAHLVVYVHELLSGNKPGIAYQSYSEPLMRGISTAVGDVPVTENFVLHQNYPNPFNPSTTIAYDVPQYGMVSIRLYDSFGREVATIVNGMQDPGTHSVMFDGSQLSSGTYFLTMRSGDFVQTRSLTLMK